MNTNEVSTLIIVGGVVLVGLYFVNTTSSGLNTGISSTADGVSTGAELAGAGVGIAAVVGVVLLFL
jgi:hypothetical protein